METTRYDEVSFTTRGQVPIGGKVVIVMPDVGGEADRGWRFESDDTTLSPIVVVTFTTPARGAVGHPTTSAVTFQTNLVAHLQAVPARQLTFTIDTSKMAQQQACVFTISKVVSPDQIVAAQSATIITTQDALGGNIDTTSTCSTDRVGVEGALTETEFFVATSSPSTLTVVTKAGSGSR